MFGKRTISAICTRSKNRLSDGKWTLCRFLGCAKIKPNRSWMSLKTGWRPTNRWHRQKVYWARRSVTRWPTEKNWLFVLKTGQQTGGKCHPFLWGSYAIQFRSIMKNSKFETNFFIVHSSWNTVVILRYNFCSFLSPSIIRHLMKSFTVLFMVHLEFEFTGFKWAL